MKDTGITNIIAMGWRRELKSMEEIKNMITAIRSSSAYLPAEGLSPQLYDTLSAV